MNKKILPIQQKARRQYDAEFKASAVQMIRNGRSVADVSRSLGVNEGLLHKWKSVSAPLVMPTDQAEIERLVKYVQQLEMERDVLKKALSIFSRTT